VIKAVGTATAKCRVLEVRGGTSRWRQDVLAAEEPLEVRLCPAAGPRVPVAVTMRTPGSDFELAAGFLFTEGILDDPGQIQAITYCTDEGVEQRYNIVNVHLRPGVMFDPQRLQRNFYATSSCGVCGKAALDAVELQGVRVAPDPGFVVDAGTILGLGRSLRRAQRIFDRTGGLHAAGLFTGDGRLERLREDIGRHNAVDKLIGGAFLAGRVPLARSLLMVSGRAGFEIVQKAAVAGIPVLVAVSAPSSLACAAARRFGLTLIGFASDARFNVYAGGERIRGAAGQGRPHIDDGDGPC